MEEELQTQKTPLVEENDPAEAELKSGSSMKRGKCKLIFIELAFIFIIFINSMVPRSIKDAKISTSLQMLDKRSAYIALISEMTRYKICNFTYNTIFLPMIKDGTLSEVGYYGLNPPNEFNSGYPYYFNRHPKDRSNNGMVGKFYDGLLYFLHNTTSDWYYRACDDAGVNPRTFPNLIDELLSLGDPEKDFIMLTACVCKSHITYPQGATGMIMSRRAAEVFLQEYDAVMKLSEVGPDDCVFGYYMKQSGISFRTTSTRWMLGHCPLGFHTFEEINKTVRSLPKCPKKLPTSSKCKMYFQRMRDLAVWHYLSARKDIIFDLSNLRDAIPENVFFYVPNSDPVFCIGDSQMESHYL